jgi:hypothetical protein
MNARRLVNRVPGRTTAAVLVLSLSFVTGIRPSIAVTDAGISADEDKTKVEEVVITGTSIKRINAETALPVQVLKRDDIARTGASTVQELFQQISSASWDRIALLRPATTQGTATTSRPHSAFRPTWRFRAEAPATQTS